MHLWVVGQPLRYPKKRGANALGKLAQLWHKCRTCAAGQVLPLGQAWANTKNERHRMQLAYVMTDARGATDRLLSQLAAELEVRDIRTAGIVQTNVERYDSELCDMDVRILPGQDSIRISQSLGPHARGCRLNPEALEQAVGLVTRALDATPVPQVLIVNKFGKHEALGRGMRPVVGEALARGLVVVSGVNKMNEQAFRDFSEGCAAQVDAELLNLLHWVEASLIASSSE